MGQIIMCPVCYEWVGIEEADAHHERHRGSWKSKAELKQLHELKIANVALSEYGARMLKWHFKWKEVQEPEPYVEPDDQVLSAPILTQGKTLLQEIGEKMGAAAARREDRHRMKQFNSFTKGRKK